MYDLNFLYVAIDSNAKEKLIYFIFFRIVDSISRLRIISQMVLKNLHERNLQQVTVHSGPGGSLEKVMQVACKKGAFLYQGNLRITPNSFHDTQCTKKSLPSKQKWAKQVWCYGSLVP